MILTMPVDKVQLLKPQSPKRCWGRDFLLCATFVICLILLLFVSYHTYVSSIDIPANRSSELETLQREIDSMFLVDDEGFDIMDFDSFEKMAMFSFIEITSDVYTQIK